jgi:hypothetical protein
VQLALSDLRVAGLRVSEARVAIANWQADVAEQRAALDELRDAAARRLEIVAEACGDELELQRRIEAMDEAATTFGLVTDFVKGIKGAATGNPADLESFFQRVVSIPRQKAEAEIARERIRIQCWKESELRGLDDQLTISSAARQLRALIRQSPQLLLNLATAAEIELQALGRLDAAVHRGLRLLEERERLEARVRGDLEDEAPRPCARRGSRTCSWSPRTSTCRAPSSSWRPPSGASGS